MFLFKFTLTSFCCYSMFAIIYVSEKVLCGWSVFVLFYFYVFCSLFSVSVLVSAFDVLGFLEYVKYLK